MRSSYTVSEVLGKTRDGECCIFIGDCSYTIDSLMISGIPLLCKHVLVCTKCDPIDIYDRCIHMARKTGTIDLLGYAFLVEMMERKEVSAGKPPEKIEILTDSIQVLFENQHILDYENIYRCLRHILKNEKCTDRMAILTIRMKLMARKFQPMNKFLKNAIARNESTFTDVIIPTLRYMDEMYRNDIPEKISYEEIKNHIKMFTVHDS